jgi:hypothetical protein
MLQKRLRRTLSVGVLGLALASAPATIASASHKTKHHHKAMHHAAKTEASGGLNPGSQLCLTVSNAESNAGNFGTTLEKSIEEAITSGNIASAKSAMITVINQSLKEEGPAESALSSAPANVQAAMKAIFAFDKNYESVIEKATSVQQFETSLTSLAGSSQIGPDSVTLANYIKAQCGTPATTTPASTP